MTKENPQAIAARVAEAMRVREEIAYTAGVKDTLTKLLPSLKTLRSTLDRQILNMEETLKLENLLKLDEAVETKEVTQEKE